MIRIQNGNRGGNSLLPGQMMIGNNQVNAQAASSFGRGKSPDAGIDGDDQTHPGRSRALDDVIFHAIAFPDSVRNVEIGRTPAKFNGSLENDDGSCAVDVVVAVDQDVFLARNRRRKALHCRFHPT